MIYTESECVYSRQQGASENLIQKALKEGVYLRQKFAERSHLTDKTGVRQKEWVKAYLDGNVED